MRPRRGIQPTQRTKRPAISKMAKMVGLLSSKKAAPIVRARPPSKSKMVRISANIPHFLFFKIFSCIKIPPKLFDIKMIS